MARSSTTDGITSQGILLFLLHVLISCKLCNCVSPTTSDSMKTANVITFHPNSPFFIQMSRIVQPDKIEKITLLSLKEGNFTLQISPRVKGITEELPVYTTKLKFDAADGTEMSADVNFKIPEFTRGKATQMVLNFTITDCEDVERKPASQCNTMNEVITVGLKQHTLIFLVETDKSQYRPGEMILFRFLVLDHRIIAPDSSEEDALPYFRKSGSVVDRSAKLKNPNKQIVKKWQSTEMDELINLSYKLLPDAPEGTWTIEVEQENESETVSILVKQYVLPKFIISNTFPKTTLSQTKEIVGYEVCARYTQGMPLSGKVNTQVCYCDKADRARAVQNQLAKPTDKRDFLEENRCPRSERPCLVEEKYLNSDGCAQYNVSLDNFQMKRAATPFHIDMTNAQLSLRLRIDEAGTKLSVKQLILGASFPRASLPSMRLKVPRVFNPGLPIMGSVTLHEISRSQVARLDLKIFFTELNNLCGREFKGQPLDRILAAVKAEFDEDGFATFTSPPIISKRPLRITATSRTILDPKTNASTTMQNEFRASVTLETWSSTTGIVLQLWPQRRIIKTTCPSTLPLTFLSNHQLRHKTFYADFVSRGKHHTKLLMDEPDSLGADVCNDQDGPLGHYKCIVNDDPTVIGSEGEIECMPGWSGQDCLVPLCHNGCNEGVCSSPGQCICPEGFNGERCEICLPRAGCMHGRCHKGNDCLCDDGWMGYNCMHVGYEPVPMRITLPLSDDILALLRSIAAETRLSSRSLFKRSLRLNIDDDLGPDARIVFYFLARSDNGSVITEYITETVTITGLDNCSSPAIARESQRTTPGLRFQAGEVSPGDSVKLSIRLPAQSNEESLPVGKQQHESESDVNTTLDDMANNNQSQAVTNQSLCYVRISDAALTSLQKIQSVVDLKTYMKKLEAYNEKYMGHTRTQTSASDTFTWAGLTGRQLGTPQLKFAHQIIYCRRRYAMMQRNHGMVPGPMPSSIMGIKRKTLRKPRLRKLFPEIWLFDAQAPQTISLTSTGVVKGLEYNLTAPDSITTWHASSYCTTPRDGLWIAPTTNLRVLMPFYVTISIPLEVKRNEILTLPVSVFALAASQSNVTWESTELTCYAVTVRMMDSPGWAHVYVPTLTDCVCQGQKKTFYMKVMAREMGNPSFTVEAVGRRNSALCISEEKLDLELHLPSLSLGAEGSDAVVKPKKPLADAVQRQIRVVPEGRATEQTVTSITCLKSESGGETIDKTVEFTLPDTVVKDSVRGYLSVSGDVMGPALANLGSLVKLPVGCGEQNMILLAPNVYVLKYLTAVPGQNTADTLFLANSAVGFIKKGIERELQYRHNDGSFSAFGKQDKAGSTWLTAFVFRVFHSVDKLTKSPNLLTPLSVSVAKVLTDAIDFLETVQDEDGCFVEKGRVLHSAMKGGKSGVSDALLTAYITSALLEVDSEGDNFESDIVDKIKSMVSKGISCLEYKLDLTEPTPEVLDQLSNYMLAQAAYVFKLHAPGGNLTDALLEQLRSIAVHDSEDPYVYWADDADTDTVKRVDTALSLETTAYAYSALVDSWSMSDLLQIISWISSKQRASGGFFSTQDTVLALKALADFGERIMATSDSEPKVVSGNFVALEEKFEFTINDDNRRVLQQKAVGYHPPDKLTRVKWSLSGAGGCVVLQSSLFYSYVENSDETILPKSPFLLSLDIELVEPTIEVKGGMKEYEKRATITVCARINETIAVYTGMVVMNVNMVTGWKPIPEEVPLPSVHSDEFSYTKFEISSLDRVTFYYNGFNSDDVGPNAGLRCAVIPVVQEISVENEKSADIEVFDYYATQLTTMLAYTMQGDEKQDIAVGVTTDAVIPADKSTQSPTETCPVCASESSTLADNIFNKLCANIESIIMIVPKSSGVRDPQISVSATAFLKENATGRLVQWDTNVSPPTNCSCLLSSWQNYTLSGLWVGLAPSSVLRDHVGSLALPIGLLTNLVLFPVLPETQTLNEVFTKHLLIATKQECAMLRNLQRIIINAFTELSF